MAAAQSSVQRPRAVLAAVAVLYLTLALTVILGRPPWEAVDEVDHVRNVETLVRGSLYRMTPGSGLEAMQPPLYYASEAAWQRLWDPGAIQPRLVGSSRCEQMLLHSRGPCWHFVQHGALARRDARIVRLLRLPGLALGLVTILLSAAAARTITRDRWSPVCAAAMVACVPTFLFQTGGVSNDVLAVALAAVATWLGVGLVSRGAMGRRRVAIGCGVLGAVMAALAQTKLTALCLLPAATLAVWLAGTTPRSRLPLLGAFVAGLLVAGGWWLVHNTIVSGDPLALAATARYNRLVGGFFETGGIDPLRQAVVEVPRVLWHGYWYSWYGFAWPWWVFVPLWGMLLVGLAGLRRVRRERILQPGPLWVLSLFALGGFLAVWVIGVQDRATQGRLALIGLPALACLVAVGYERLRLPLLARFIPALLTLGVSAVAIVQDVLTVAA